jgi:tRNA nucleotidyltransferase (CCA-adding enzyme)
MDINLTSQEKSIIDYLRNSKESIPELRHVDMRIAGGWVRDKLMGKDSDDIDIAISNISGYDIVNILKLHDVNGSLGSTFTVSLDKSLKSENREDLNKLQVGGVDMWGQKVEFVPMRTERYEPGSRTPILDITDDPKLDAMRRDLTINSLYYNIETGMIEDYIGGVSDLKNMILKTPDDAKKTFSEDPLRVLRVLRFFSKYHKSKIDQSIIDAMKDPEIQQAYMQKVAPERAGTEIMKLMAGEKPDEAIRILFESGMHKQVFGTDIFDSLNPFDMDQKTPHHKHNLIDHTILTMKNINNISRNEGLSDKERALMTMSAMFHDIGKLDPNIAAEHSHNPGQMTYYGHEKASADIVDIVLKRLGIGNDRKFVSTIVRYHMRPHKQMPTPKAIGKFIRDTNLMEGSESRPMWKYVMLHSMADTMSKGGVDYEEDIEMKENLTVRIEQFIEDQKAKGMSAESKKPILNGKDIISAIPEVSPKSGFINKVNQMLLEAQDEGSVYDENSAMKFLESIKNKIIEEFGDKREARNWFGRLKIAEKTKYGSIFKNNTYIRSR